MCCGSPLSCPDGFATDDVSDDAFDAHDTNDADEANDACLWCQCSCVLRLLWLWLWLFVGCLLCVSCCCELLSDLGLVIVSRVDGSTSDSCITGCSGHARWAWFMHHKCRNN